MLRFPKLFNKVWGLEGCSPFLSPKYKSLSQARLLCVNRAIGFDWSVSVVQHDSWCNQTINYQLIWLEASQVYHLH